MGAKAQLENAVHPILKDLGFRNRALIWNRTVNEIIQVIHFQIDQHPASSSSRVTVNLGVCCPKIRHLVWGDQEPNCYDETDCCPRFRVGYLLANEELKYLDRWWVIEDDVYSPIGEILDVLTEQCIPYLNRLSTLSEMYRLACKLKPKMQVADKIYLAVMSHLLNHNDERDAIFTELMSSRTVAWRARIDQVLERLGLSIDMYT